MNAYLTVERFLPRLKHYCRSLTGNEWDAEDLVQEVLTKVYRSLQQSPDRGIGIAFLYRIAQNAWIDHCRKQQASEVFDEEMHLTTSSAWSEMEIREQLEHLADQLNSRQMVLILVMDIFQFSAAETAELLKSTVGAVKEGLKRARHRLKALAAKSRLSPEENGRFQTNKPKLEAGTTPALFERFLTGFRAGDPEEICRAYLELSSQGVYIEKITPEAGVYSFTFRDPNGHLIAFFQEI
ncbi:sigma-70 family RNA polymerase sigma factor [Paenibacillus mesophilus]|uniref:sigma-70 family RNA polymerase sigma factor n=1 Tax=Paenibacillus mesophilus TaxID=2582849 RepID=UPI001EE3AD11|nr:sigma-70 family RNA polymerase sigma factor [Paenibacillus mesophilus]